MPRNRVRRRGWQPVPASSGVRRAPRPFTPPPHADFASMSHFRHLRRLRHRLLFVLAAAAALPGASARAQAGSAEAALTAGSELERYLRTLQDVGAVPQYPWGARSFAPAEAARIAPLGTHPWQSLYAAPADSGGRARVRLVAPEVEAAYNSAYPFGMNDGAVWVGRGLTVSATAGVMLRAGPLTVRAAPVVFWAQNRQFALMPNGLDSAQAYQSGYAPQRIDLPQRFGGSGYARLDPGESYARLDVGVLAVGVSTATEVWGPAQSQPIVLGNNAPGFPRVFAGTSRPVNVGVGRLHARVVWGELYQSDFSPAPDSIGRRFATGAVFSFTPAGIDGLEVGGTRFFHVSWPRDGLGLHEVFKLFEPFPKSLLDSTGVGFNRSRPDNQIASAFARWVFPRAGLEVYGEYGREDHNWDLRDFILEPDHASAYLLGFRKAWGGGQGPLWALRGEVLNTQRSHLAEVRGQFLFYTHAGAARGLVEDGTPQGHTNQGQVLGAPFGLGGGGSVVGVDRYGRGGRVSLEWIRGRLGDRWTYDDTGAVASPRDTDVLHALSLDGVTRRGPLDLSWGVAAVYELNRYFQSDRFNLNARLGARLPL